MIGSEDVLDQENGLLNVGNWSEVGKLIACDVGADGAALGEVVVEYVVEMQVLVNKMEYVKRRTGFRMHIGDS